MEVLMTIWPPFSEMVLDGSKPYIFRKKILQGMEEGGLWKEEGTVYLYDIKGKGGKGKVIGKARLMGCYGLHYSDDLDCPEMEEGRELFLKAMYLDWCSRGKIWPNMKQGWLKSRNFKQYQKEIGFTASCNYALVLADPVCYGEGKNLSDFVDSKGAVMLKPPKNMRLCCLDT